jgi:hypothetical protein
MRGSARGKYLNCYSARAPWLSDLPHTPVDPNHVSVSQRTGSRLFGISRRSSGEWGIGLILGLSEHTMEKFIQSARIKLPRCEANACRGQADRLRLVASDPPLTRSCRGQKKAGGRSICINCGGTPLQFIGSGLPNKTMYAMGTLRTCSRCAFLPALPDKSSSGQQMRG